MLILLTIVHVLVAIFLILVVLLQTGRGAEMGASFGGSSNTVFGSSGPAGFMAKLTTAAAVVFMATSLLLAYSSLQGSPRVTGSPAGSPVSPLGPEVPAVPGSAAMGTAMAPVAPAEGGTPSP